MTVKIEFAVDHGERLFARIAGDVDSACVNENGTIEGTRDRDPEVVAVAEAISEWMRIDAMGGGAGIEKLKRRFR